MKLHTEKEQLLNLEYNTYRLRNLYWKDVGKFKELMDYLPYGYYLNNKENSQYEAMDAKLIGKGREIEILVEKGMEYLPEISNVELLRFLNNKIQNYYKQSIEKAGLSYLQQIRINGEMTDLHTTKYFLQGSIYLNMICFLPELGKLEGMAAKILRPLERKHHLLWKRYRLLSDSAREMIDMLSKGMDNKQIGGQLHLSTHTVKTHLKYIYEKLDVRTLAELIRIHQFIELAE
ncbi:MAG: helix-turn-helix transcriptional regulator [Flavobacteriaceae bacterium]|nr:helix-turn-helix transcriptional regulator [Flavobacteriaceae bacterium]